MVGIPHDLRGGGVEACLKKVFIEFNGSLVFGIEVCSTGDRLRTLYSSLLDT